MDNDNKALADRLNEALSARIDSVLASIEGTILAGGELAGLLTECGQALSPQADKARGEVVAWAKASELEALSKPLHGGRLGIFVGQVSDEHCNVPLYTTPQPQGDASPNADRMAIKMLVAAGFVTEAKANEALNIAHGFDKGPLTPQARPDGGAVAPWRAHDGAIDAKALAVATEIALMWGRDRSQFVSRIQVAVREAMDWTAGGNPAPAPDVARLVEAGHKVLRHINWGRHLREAATELDEALTPFTQQGATNGQESDQ